jgi:hypothetical protein
MLNAQQSSAYNSSVRSINDDFAAKRAANTFSRSLSARQGARNLTDFSQGFRRQMPQFQAGYAKRNLGQSGIYQRALQNFTGDYARDFGRMQEDNASNQYQFDMNDAQMVSERDRVLADLDLQKQIQIATTASHINNLKPYMS